VETQKGAVDEIPKGAVDAQKGAVDEIPKGAVDAPKGAVETRRGAVDGPKRAGETPKRPVDGPKRAGEKAHTTLDRVPVTEQGTWQNKKPYDASEVPGETKDHRSLISSEAGAGLSEAPVKNWMLAVIGGVSFMISSVALVSLF
jgi:hypothetical protein